MTKEKSSVRLRVLCKPIPPNTWLGKATEFGVRHRDGTIVFGRGGAGSQFAVELEWALDPKQESPRFYGPIVFKSGKEQQSLYLVWRYRSSRETINAVKVHLEGIDADLLERAKKTGGVLETKAETPRWGVDNDWHGLGVGREWNLKAK
jgi:hypothetical protein